MPFPYMSISPSWCWMCEGHSEAAAHLFCICSFAACFWQIVLDAFGFGWSVVSANNIFDILAYLLVGHPFHGLKKMFWLAILRAFFWTLWGKRNKRFSRDSFSSFGKFVELVLSTTLCWCKNRHPFKSSI